MLNFSRWTRTFVPYEKWDSPKVQKMTHNAKFDHQGGNMVGQKFRHASTMGQGNLGQSWRNLRTRVRRN